MKNINCKMRKFFLLFLLLLWSEFISSQDIDPLSRSKAENPNRDTSAFHLANVRFQEEVVLRGYANLDTIRVFGHAALREAQKVNYNPGLIQVYLGFGSAYISKINVDSAKYYYNMAIGKAGAIRDSHLLARSYLGYGYALVYDHSDYDGAIRATQKGYQVSKAINDTSLLIDANNKLVAIYDLSQDILSAYKACSELFHISLLRKDTMSLITNYYMLGSLYANLNLFDKQLQIVHRSIALLPHTKDPVSLYTIYRTVADGYLGKREYDSVLYYTRINLPLCQKLNKMTTGYGYLGKVYLETNQLDSAKYYYSKMVNEQKANGMYIDTYEYLDLGQIEFKLGHIKKAFNYYKIAEANIERPSLYTQKEIYKALSVYYNTLEMYQEAFAYLEKHNRIVEQINNNQNYDLVSDFEAEKLNAEIQLLTKDKALQVSLSARHSQQKNIAYSGIAFILLAAGWGFIRYKKQKDLKSQQVLLQDRLRISRELHDEVGATLSGISMYSHIATAQLKKENAIDLQNSLSFIQQSAGEMITKLSDIVWLINPQQDTIMEILGRLAEYGKQMTRARNMQIRIDLPPDLASQHIPMEARRNIYLFCKEAINNAVKYSHGKLIVLQVKLIGQKMIFSVTDDGNGFDESIIKNGNGLVNMQKRAEDIGAVFHMDTKVNRGTRMELQYKIIQ
jgi:signal transduction histidine kinase